MTFEEIVDQALAMLQRRGRMAYRTLKRQFQLDDDALEDLKTELIKAQRLAVDEEGEVLVWTGGPSNPGAPAGEPRPAPLTYTPPYLAEKILTSRSALEGERKQVTVLFADLKGSMELLADRDPEEARTLLDPVLERMMAAVHRYEGTVNQVMGDGIMALFGAPIAHEDHAVRACYAALAMHAALRRYSDEVRRTHGLAVHFRVGLNSGEVVVRGIHNDLHMDYSAIGQTVHLAARMEQLATPGSILLTPATLRLVEGLVQVHTLGPMLVKGLAEPVEVAELVGAPAVRRRLQATAARGLTRFVGRQTELDVLHQALERAGTGHGQVVALVGEPGVGKSRLVYEFLHSAHTRGWRVLESASVSYGKATPYFPMLDLLQRYCGIEGEDDARTIRAKVTGHLLTLDEALQETVPALLALLDALPEDHPFQNLDAPQRRQRTLEALTRVLLRESQAQPLLLVVEDLHWIDSETQALLDRLVEGLPTARLLLLVNYRPEYQHGRGNKTYYTQLRLDPLPPASADELLQALLGDDPSLASLKRSLIERTEGNPFFLEESVRTLVETGGLVGAPGAYHRSKPLDSLQVPATVQAVLAARIDRLPPEEKRLLQAAAVIGMEVPWPLLEVVAGIPDEALRQGLAHLQATEVLYEASLFPELTYTFKHALTHEVAYSSLLRDRRLGLHAKIVEAMERLYGDQLANQVERLAHHTLQGEVWDKAVAYSWQAGAKAGARPAYQEAVAYFEQALQALPHLPESQHTLERAIDLRLDLRPVLQARGEIGRMHDYLREAALLAEALGDQRRLGAVCRLLCGSFWMMGDYGPALEVGQRALVTSIALGDMRLQFNANHRLALTCYTQGEYRRAIEFLRTNVVCLEGALPPQRVGPAVPISIDSRVWLSRCLGELGAFAEGIEHGEEAMRMAEALDHPYSHAAAYSGIGILYLRQGAIQKAIPVLERAVELCQGWRIQFLFPWVASPLGVAYAQSGRVAEALPLLEQAVEQAASMRFMAHASTGLAALSEGHLLAGRWDEALLIAQRALHIAGQHNERGHQVYVLHLLGTVAAHGDPPENVQAEGYYRQALALAEELGMRPLMAHCHLGLGSLYATTGRREQARPELSAAIALYRAMDMTFWLPQAEAALAQVEGC